MVLPRGRSPRGRSVDELIQVGTKLFDVIDAARPEYAEVKASLARLEPGKEQGDLMRIERRKTLLFSTTTCASSPVPSTRPRRLTARTTSSSTVTGSLGSTSNPTRAVHRPPGELVGGTGTPSARNQEVFAATRALTEAIQLPHR